MDRRPILSWDLPEFNWTAALASFAIGPPLWHIAGHARYRFPTKLMANPYEAPFRSASAPRPTTTDPVLRSAWREALLVFGLWGTAMAWSVGYCAIHAYPPKDKLAEAAAKLTYTLGFPTWVFYGIVLPWVLCAILSSFISRFVITDEDLGIEPEEALKEIIDG